MTKFKSALLLLSGMLTFANAASANEKGGALSVDQKVEMLMTRLKLTPDQAANLKTILDGQMAKKDAAGSDAERQAIVEETNQKVRDILTDDQTVKYDQMRYDWEKSEREKP